MASSNTPRVAAAGASKTVQAQRQRLGGGLAPSASFTIGPWCGWSATSSTVGEAARPLTLDLFADDPRAAASSPSNS